MKHTDQSTRKNTRIYTINASGKRSYVQKNMCTGFRGSYNISISTQSPINTRNYSEIGAKNFKSIYK